MTIKRDVLGYRYDDDEPAFTELQDGFYYHLRHPKKKYEKIAFDAWLVDIGSAFGVGELGIPSLAYILTHESILRTFEPPAGSALMFAVVSKEPVGVDDTGEITITGGPTSEPIDIGVVVYDSSSEYLLKPQFSVRPRNAETATEVAARIAASGFLDPGLLSVTSAAGVITFTPSAGGSLETFLVTVTRP